MGTQADRLVKYFLMHGKINPLEAWQNLGIYRLAAQVHILRNLGYKIETQRKSVMNRWGEECSVANYIFKGAPINETD